MPAIQLLKKQLRGIKSTQKLTKAMRTVSTVKFSKLNGIYTNYAQFGRNCVSMYENYKTGFVSALPKTDKEAPVLIIVIASDKGLCGSFNSELLNFALEYIEGMDFPYLLMPYGKRAVSFFKDRNFELVSENDLGDNPTYAQAEKLLSDIVSMMGSGKISSVRVVYPKYYNMMKQKPVAAKLFEADSEDAETDIVFVPDKKTFVTKSANTVLASVLYEILLESALGAQAATLMTMRSAYDTATEYCEQLEGQINRQRQSAVTADVIETSSEVIS